METWTVDFYYRRGESELVHDNKGISLPNGYFRSVLQELVDGHESRKVGGQGVLSKLEDWGVKLCTFGTYSSQQCAFSLPQGTRRRGQVYSIEIKESPSGIVRVTQGKSAQDTVIIGSPKHPFKIYSPDGKLMGTYTVWRDFRTKQQDAARFERLERTERKILRENPLVPSLQGYERFRIE